MPKNRIHKRSDGRYSYHVSDKNGRRHYLISRHGEGQRQFSQRCDELDRSSQTVAGASALTFDDLFTLWKRAHLSTTSAAHATVTTGIYNSNLRSQFGRHRLNVITTQMVYDFLQDLVASGYSKSYIRKVRGCLAAPFRWAKTSGLYNENPCEGLRLSYRSAAPKSNTNRALTDETLDRFFTAAATSKYFNYFRLLLLTGMRPSEALGLKWTDIENGRIHINRGITIYGISDGKTDHAHRRLPITDEIAEILNAEKNPTEWLFPSTTGVPNAEAVKSAFTRAKRQTSV